MGKLDAVGIYNKPPILAEPNSADWAFKTKGPGEKHLKTLE